MKLDDPSNKAGAIKQMLNNIQTQFVLVGGGDAMASHVGTDPFHSPSL